MNMIVGIDYPKKKIAINNKKYFIPASNTKLFTSFFALKVLGNDYRFYSCYSIKNDKLYIKTLGNPLITQDNILEITNKINNEIKEIYLYYDYLKPTERPPGWCIDDIHEPYAPPVSEINYEMNRIEIKNKKMFPKNNFFDIKIYNGKSFINDNKIFLNRRNKNFSFSPNNPIEIFKNSLILILKEKGLLAKSVKFINKNFKIDCEYFAERSMSEILKIMNKESENSVAEALLLHAGMVSNHRGLKNSLLFLKKILKDEKIKNFVLYDGSGLSHYNLTTPNTITLLLEKLINNEIFKGSLPVGSIDGTLKNRLNPRIKAKTGTLNHVQNLSGYFDSNPFSIMLNGVTNQKYAKKFIDEYITYNF